MNIMIYTLKRNFDVQKAERFFKERHIPYQLVDLKKHRLGQKEIQLFIRRLGAVNLVEKNAETLSLPIGHTDDVQYITEELLLHPNFIRTPIVRNGEKCTLGVDENTWMQWIQAGK
ncbi:MAG: ArsC family transcriptional regulator [Clostridia bacterium]|nr:ArsC family transcriptional regulator [Clostridia bacterium]